MAKKSHTKKNRHNNIVYQHKVKTFVHSQVIKYIALRMISMPPLTGLRVVELAGLAPGRFGRRV